MVQENKEEFAEALATDLGKPKLNAYVQESAPLSNAASPGLAKAWKPTVYKAAKGTVLVISPWNFPLVLSLQTFLGAIAAGCCSLETLGTIPALRRASCRALPKISRPCSVWRRIGWCSLDCEDLRASMDHRNGRIACIISAPAAKHLTPLVDPSLDINLAAKRPLWAKSQNCGQLCVAPDYVLILRTHQEEFLAALKASYAEFFPEGSMSSSSISRIVSPEHHARLVDLLARTRGEVVLGGKTEGDEKIEITVVEDVGANDSLMEGCCIFGPFLPVLPVDSVEEALEFVRVRDHPPVFYAFTENPGMKKKNEERRCRLRRPRSPARSQEMPFGGVGEFGYGS
ncbi:aldehyde dehydrogenase [Mycena vulgaris]|nr:aldehyde dehydrogenase [Mycena vulgaris]